MGIPFSKHAQYNSTMLDQNTFILMESSWGGAKFKMVALKYPDNAECGANTGRLYWVAHTFHLKKMKINKSCCCSNCGSTMLLHRKMCVCWSHPIPCQVIVNTNSLFLTFILARISSVPSYEHKTLYTGSLGL